MDDLIVFLRAQLEKDAERAYSGWGRDPEGRWENMDEGNSVMTPRAVLADVAAKREIVDLLVTYETAIEQERSTLQRGATVPATLFAARDAYRMAVRLFAEPFSSHPDYREEWKP